MRLLLLLLVGLAHHTAQQASEPPTLLRLGRQLRFRLLGLDTHVGGCSRAFTFLT